MLQMCVNNYQCNYSYKIYVYLTDIQSSILVKEIFLIQRHINEDNLLKQVKQLIFLKFTLINYNFI